MFISSFGLTSIPKTLMLLMRWFMPDIQKISLFNDQGMVSDFRQLIDANQIPHHFKCCQLPNGKCRFGYPQEMAGHTRIHGHNHDFARDAEEQDIVPDNPSLLASFRAHHCVEVIHSEQWIGYVLKYAQRILIPAGYHPKCTL
jgi:hypothetical protein